jgi:hypothetical protein
LKIHFTFVKFCQNLARIIFESKLLTSNLGFSKFGLQATIGLCDVGEFEILPPGTTAQLKNKCTKKVQKMIEKLLPEPKPNSEPMLMGIAAAPILQNPLLYAVNIIFQELEFFFLCFQSPHFEQMF